MEAHPTFSCRLSLRSFKKSTHNPSESSIDTRSRNHPTRTICVNASSAKCKKSFASFTPHLITKYAITLTLWAGLSPTPERGDLQAALSWTRVAPLVNLAFYHSVSVYPMLDLNRSPVMKSTILLILEAPLHLRYLQIPFLSSRLSRRRAYPFSASG